MPNFPTDNAPRWAEDAGASVLEPSLASREAGYSQANRPAADHFNWLFRTFSRLFDWAKASFGDTIVEVVPVTAGFTNDMTLNHTTLVMDVNAVNDTLDLPIVARPGYVLVEYGFWDRSSSLQNRTWDIEIVDVTTGGLAVAAVSKQNTTQTNPERATVTSANTGTLPYTVPGSATVANLTAQITLSAATTPADLELLSLWFRWQREAVT